MPRLIDLEDMRFGRLVVIKMIRRRDHWGQIKWLCQCDCGKKKDVRGISLRIGDTTSCGCFHKEVTSKRSRIHGLSENVTPEYRKWKRLRRKGLTLAFLDWVKTQ